MMDAKELLNSLTVDEIVHLLTELGSQEIHDLSESKGHLITNTICHNVSDGKMKLYYYTEGNGKFEGRKFHCFTACGDSFDIYELVKRSFALKDINMSFRDIINWICDKTGRKNYGYSKPEGFGHGESTKLNEELEYLKKFNKKRIEEPNLISHDERILDRFTNHHHQSWLEDNISHDAMNKFNIKYDYINHTIIIPHYHHDEIKGLCGIRVRNLDEDKIRRGMKYIPYQTFGETGILYSYPTHYNLYGLRQNRKHIEKTKRILVVEGEKSVLQCETYFPGENFAVALSGSSLSQKQCELILGTGAEVVYIGLDKEYKSINGEDFKAYQRKILQLVYALIPYVKVKIVHDSTDDMLSFKQSPTDRDKETLITLMKNAKIASLIDE